MLVVVQRSDARAEAEGREERCLVAREEAELRVWARVVAVDVREDVGVQGARVWTEVGVCAGEQTVGAVVAQVTVFAVVAAERATYGAARHVMEEAGAQEPRKSRCHLQRKGVEGPEEAVWVFWAPCVAQIVGLGIRGHSPQ